MTIRHETDPKRLPDVEKSGNRFCFLMITARARALNSNSGLQQLAIGAMHGFNVTAIYDGENLFYHCG